MGFFIIPFMGVIASAVFMLVKRFSEEMTDSSLPVEELRAIVVAKRMHLTGGDNAATLYYATFELADDRRLELRLGGEAYGALAEGDSGVLRKRGTRFVSFNRVDDRYDARSAAEREHKCAACGAPYVGRVCPYCGTPSKNN